MADLNTPLLTEDDLRALQAYLYQRGDFSLNRYTLRDVVQPLVNYWRQGDKALTALAQRLAQVRKERDQALETCADYWRQIVAGPDFSLRQRLANSEFDRDKVNQALAQTRRALLDAQAKIPMPNCLKLDACRLREELDAANRDRVALKDAWSREVRALETELHRTRTEWAKLANQQVLDARAAKAQPIATPVAGTSPAQAETVEYRTVEASACDRSVCLARLCQALNTAAKDGWRLVETRYHRFDPATGTHHDTAMVERTLRL